MWTLSRSVGSRSVGKTENKTDTARHRTACSPYENPWVSNNTRIHAAGRSLSLNTAFGASICRRTRQRSGDTRLNGQFNRHWLCIAGFRNVSVTGDTPDTQIGWHMAMWRNGNDNRVMKSALSPVALQLAWEHKSRDHQ
jgi:hypothetical protein